MSVEGGNGSGLPPSNLSVDSISLGQLKNFIGNNQKPKQSWFDFKYDDEDTVMNEIEEFYSYIEMPQVAENMKAWEGCFPSEWTKAPLNQRRTHIEFLLESLEHRDVEIRFTNARRLFYVLQGTFAETVSPEHQLHWIVENCKIVRSANGIPSIVEALKIAGRKHDLLSNLSDQEAAHYYISAQDKSDLMEEVLTEISVYLGMLYHLVEVFKGHDDFADELMSLDPPLPVYLFNLVAGLRDKSAKGYPIKKLLLLLWKSLLACWGGMKDHERVKKIARELAGLPSYDGGDKIKTTPIDIETFRQEMFVKYPTFAPPNQPPPSLANAPISNVANPAHLTRRLSEAYSPIPIRHHYHHDEPDPPMPISQQNSSQFGQFGQHGSFMRHPQPPTPVPSPPPGPKPKKQAFQTDQNRPFLFPFSKSIIGNDGKLVPFAIDEADRLYSKHMFVSLALTQMWRTREDCMSAESGLERMPGTEGELRSSTYNPDEAETGEPLPDIKLLEEKIQEAEAAVKNAQTPTEKRKALERREDLLRLRRVEQIYESVLPVLSAWVLVLLKLLLATVSPNATHIPVPQSSTSSVFPPVLGSPPEQLSQPPPTLDEIDVVRHREITSKAVSAILLLVLKWFKVSHVMKFHHLGGHLLDTNCLLLILKMFGLQEVSQTVLSKADSPENNFFRYCLTNLSKNPQLPRPEDVMIKPPRQIIIRTVTLPNGERHEEEVEQLTDYSWRNFFSTINFAKIMQKLSKGRAHRIFMLVQYKSSAVLKRVLRVPHPLLQLHILKLIKSQVPFCGKKWRQTNMKVITAIYLNCRPDLRDEWLTGTEPEDAGDAQIQEQALRQLVKFYNSKRYGPTGMTAPPGHHRRTGSMSHYLEGLQADPQLASLIRPLGTPNTVDSDVFPPSRSQAPNPSIFLPYTTEDLAFEEEYEEYLSDLGLSDDYHHHAAGGQAENGSGSAWHRLPEYVSELTDNISDSESIVSIGDLGDENENKEGQNVVDENLNNWEHLSPKTMAALPKSPATGRRRSSSGGSLRPVIPFGLDDGTAVEDVGDEEDEEEIGPIQHSGPSVDEVEYAYGHTKHRRRPLPPPHPLPPSNVPIIDLFILYECQPVFQLKHAVRPLISPNTLPPPRRPILSAVSLPESPPEVAGFYDMSQQHAQDMQAMMQDPIQQPPPDGQGAGSTSYYPQETDLTGGLPINLDSLRDGPPGSKPFYPYSTLIRYAIKGSPNGKLLLEDIYYAIESRFPYFRTAPSGWKNSVRHNLSLNPCFEKVPRPLTDRGKGSYWTVNENVDPRTGVHRVRKKKNKKQARLSEEPDADYRPPDHQVSPGAQAHFEDHAAVAAAAAAAAAGHQFVPPPMPGDEPGTSRQAGPYPPTAYPPSVAKLHQTAFSDQHSSYSPLTFDPNFPMMGMRFPVAGPMPIAPDESFDVDEHGNINWRLAWLKEIGHLQQVTQEQEKAGADQEWYRMMLFRIRAALMPPPINPEVMHQMVPHMQPPPGAELQQPAAAPVAPTQPQ